MFKMGLLMSTAMTAVAWLSCSAPDAAQAQTGMHVAHRDANARFLCTYGQFDVSYYRRGISGSYTETWTDVAVPFTGHGETVHQILVQEGNGIGLRRFYAGIYSNTASGFPGNLIAGGFAKAPSNCTKVVVPISATTLVNKKTYWIVEQTRQHGHATRLKYWAVDPGTRRKAYVRHYSFSNIWSSYSNLSPWIEQSMGPFFKLK